MLPHIWKFVAPGHFHYEPPLVETNINIYDNLVEFVK